MSSGEAFASVNIPVVDSSDTGEADAVAALVATAVVLVVGAAGVAGVAEDAAAAPPCQPIATNGLSIVLRAVPDSMIAGLDWFRGGVAAAVGCVRAAAPPAAPTMAVVVAVAVVL
jgi:hypothetical protein